MAIDIHVAFGQEFTEYCINSDIRLIQDLAISAAGKGALAYGTKLVARMRTRNANISGVVAENVVFDKFSRAAAGDEQARLFFKAIFEAKEDKVKALEATIRKLRAKVAEYDSTALQLAVVLAGQQ
ncbi:hypothetical protein LTR17_020959 [Elasticomyces elasticus]|nr:hypothetical protein LTR17_020959 [Elasticomyces elasticus]